MTSVRNDGLIEFRFFRPDVAEVSIAGDFNNWCATSLTMHRDPSGWWTATTRLPAGEYRFRYNADGQWFADFASHGVEFVKEGWNSVLLVRSSQMNNPVRCAA